MADADARPDGPDPTWGRLAAFALATRVLVLLAGAALAPAAPGPHWTPAQAESWAVVLAGPVPWLEPWVRLDADHYLLIAREGYAPAAREGWPLAGFLPLLPALIAVAAAAGLNPVLAAVVIPNLAFVAGLACAGRAALRATGSRRAVWVGCVVLVTYPFAFYFSAPYHESLYLLAAGAGLLAWYDRRPGLAGVAGFIAMTGRLTAVAFPVGLFAEAVVKKRWPAAGAWVVAAGTAAGLALVLAYFAHATGDPLAHFRAHAAWGREPASVGGVGRALASAVRELVAPNPGYTVVKPLALVVVIALGVRGWVRRGPLWGCVILVPVAQALSTGTTLSIERVVLTAFPAAFEAGDLLSRSRIMLLCWVAAAVPAQAFFLRMFVNNGFLN